MSPSAKNIQIQPSRKKGKKRASVILSNELSIYTIEGIKDKIVDTFKKYDEIEFKATDVKNMDLTFVQLLESIQKTAKTEGKKVEFNIDLKDENIILFENTDLNKIIKNKEI